MYRIRMQQALCLIVAVVFMMGCATTRDAQVSAPPKSPAQLVIDKYIEATGGRTAWENTKTLELTGKLTAMGMALDMKDLRKGENKMSFTASMAGNPVAKIVFDGENSSVTQMGQTTAMQPIQLARAKEGQRLELNMEKHGATAELVGEEEINGKTTKKLAITHADGQVSHFYYDVETGYKIRMEVKSESPMGGVIVQTMTFSDFRPVGDLTLAHKVELNSGGQVMSITANEYRVNGEIPDETFAVK